MLVKRTNHSYDLNRCLVEWENIQSRFGDNLWSKPLGENRQTCIQRSNESGGNPFTDGTGSIYGNNPVKDHILISQSDYIILNDIYEGTVFADVIRDMNGERSRVMHMSSHSTYSVHKDKSPRYHLVLITNPNAYFIFPTLNEIVHIPADGCVYEVDTTLPHSFVNCGKERDHLVMSKKLTS